MREELLEKYLRGIPLSRGEEGSLEEALGTEEGAREFARFLEEWSLLAKASSKLAEADRLSRWVPGIPSGSRGLVSERMLSRTSARKPPGANPWWWVAIAASLLFMLVLGYLLGEGRERGPESSPVSHAIRPTPRNPHPELGREERPQPASAEARSPMLEERPAPLLPRPAPDATQKTEPRPQPERLPEKPVPPVVAPEPIVPPAAPRGIPLPADDKPSTVISSLTLAKSLGEVFVLSGKGRTPARDGQPLSSAEGLETVGAHSTATVRFQDGTLLELSGETEVESFLYPGFQEAGASGARVHLARGSIHASVPKLPPERPLVFSSPHASARILGTRFTLVARPELSALEVTEGRVRFTGLDTGAAVDVFGGSTAIAGPGIPLFALSTKGKDGRSFPLKTEVATRRGIDYLLRRGEFGSSKEPKDELVLLALLGAGLSEDHPKVQELQKKMLEAPLEKTYLVALQAVILEDLDRVRYQPRIAQCAQFLVDNMCRNGQWDYGTPSAFAEIVPGAGTPGHPPAKVPRKIAVQKRREGPAKGDNSNSQYAALGLRAASDAGIALPREVLVQARRWWTDSQQPESQDRDPGAAGWSYGARDNYHSYGSMTAGGAAALAIYASLLEGSWQADRALQKGIEWISRHFTVSGNPGPAEIHAFGGENRFYYLYAVARLGTGCGLEAFGGQDWYGKGASSILAAQKPDGAWREDDTVCDTCFSILFLRRAMRPLLLEKEPRSGGKK